MVLRNAALSAAIATSLIAAPVMAEAAPAPRTSTFLEGESLRGHGIWILALLIAAGAVAIIASNHHHHDLPHSP